MKTKTSLGRTNEPWTHAVQMKEHQGTRRNSEVTQKIKRQGEARRRDDKSSERRQEDPPAGTVRAEDIYTKSRRLARMSKPTVGQTTRLLLLILGLAANGQ